MAKYNSIDTIPAKVFWDVLKSKNYQLLKPKPREKGLEDVFIGIYDEFFIKSDNSEAKRYLQLTKEVSFLEWKIAVIKQVLHFTYYNTTTKEMRYDIIKALKTGCNIDIDTEQPFVDEVQRVLHVEIGILMNDLNFSKLELENMIKSSQGKDYDYYDRIGALSQVLQNNSLLKEDMTLAVQVSLEKIANKIIKEQKAK
jgi:hypothetical protein